MTDAEVETLRKRIEELEQQLTEEREEFEWDLKAAKESAARSVNKMEEDVARLKQALSEGGGGGGGGDAEALTQRALMAERKVAELQQELKRERDLTAQPAQPGDDSFLRQRAESAEKERDDLRRETRAMKRSLDDSEAARQRIGSQAGDAKELKREVEDLKWKLSNQEREIKRMRDAATTESGAPGEALTDVETERNELRKQLEQAKAQEEKHQRTLADMCAVSDSIAAEAEPLKARISELQSELERNNEEMAKLKIASSQMLEHRERSAERLKADLESASGDQDSFRRKISTLEAELEGTRSELRILSQERDEVVAQVRALHDPKSEGVQPPAAAATGPETTEDRTTGPEQVEQLKPLQLDAEEPALPEAAEPAQLKVVEPEPLEEDESEQLEEIDPIPLDVSKAQQPFESRPGPVDAAQPTTPAWPAGKVVRPKGGAGKWIGVLVGLAVAALIIFGALHFFPRWFGPQEAYRSLSPGAPEQPPGPVTPVPEPGGDEPSAVGPEEPLDKGPEPDEKKVADEKKPPVKKKPPRRKVAKKDKKAGRRHLKKGNDLIRARNFKGAVNEYIKALKANPSLARAYRGLGISYAQLKQDKNACNAYRRYLKMIPRNSKEIRSLKKILAGCK